jgi:hypothetical protein
MTFTPTLLNYEESTLENPPIKVNFLSSNPEMQFFLRTYFLLKTTTKTHDYTVGNLCGLHILEIPVK